MDGDFSVFSILPPYNTIHAQLVDANGKLTRSATGATVTYEAVADPSGSINTSSAGKTNFRSFANFFFGVSLPVDSGLKGNSMPGTANQPRKMIFDPAYDWFSAESIPLVPYDDNWNKNAYPMLRLVARDTAGNALVSTRIVLPVSDEMDCRACHASGSKGPAKPAAGYSAAGLFASAAGGNPALCAKCHASAALSAPGVTGVPSSTSAVHLLHAAVDDPVTGQTLDSSANRSACYRCHPDSQTRCLRGAMGKAVAPDGSMEVQCRDCHGSMSVTGDPGRQGRLQEPACQACHTGTAATNRGQLRFTNLSQASGALRQPANPTFATTPNQPAAGLSLYRLSIGHGGLQCEACHGSTHAEFESLHPNDNLRGADIQGFAGPLQECTTSGRRALECRRARLGRLPDLPRHRLPGHSAVGSVHRGCRMARRQDCAGSQGAGAVGIRLGGQQEQGANPVPVDPRRRPPMSRPFRGPARPLDSAATGARLLAHRAFRHAQRAR